MSHIKYNNPIENASGRLDHESNISHRTLYGKKHTYCWNPETVIRHTPGRLIHWEAMGQANQFAVQALADERSSRYWRDLYATSKHQGSIISFIIKQKLPEIKAALLAEWKDRPLSELEAYFKKQKSIRQHLPHK